VEASLLWLHIGAATFGFIAFLATGNRFIAGVAAPIWLPAGGLFIILSLYEY
jgi:hypothetical protein